MCRRFFLALVPFLLLLTRIKSEQASSSDNAAFLFDSMVEWVTGKGGVFNPKQEYRRVDPTDPNSPFGIFARERIEMGQVLYSVPWKCIIHGKPGRYTDGLHCGTVRVLIEELKKGNSSKYAPYVNYLLSQPHGQVPSAWSDVGKDLLEEISGYDQLPPSEPVLWLDKDWKVECDGSDDPFEQNAAMLVLSRAEDELMVPFHDLYGHRNGRYFNADAYLTTGKKHELVATRTIEKGEAIHVSYNRCHDCNDRRNTYGTPEILRDFGIVEELPQSFFFPWLEFGFYIDEDSFGELSVTWARSKPSTEGIAYLQSQLLRLKQVVQPDLQQVANEALGTNKTLYSSETVPEYEWNIINKYFESLVVAFEKAIEAAGGVDESKCRAGSDKDGRCIIDDGYDDLSRVNVKYMNYQSYCDNLDIVSMEEDSMTLIERNVNAEVQSPFQLLTFMERDAEVKDTCLELDNMLQICTSFRPHYHEYVTHFPARYKEEIKRVLFVGGGDSMVLHEMLKYPNIELIVGLELDQAVVRESMKQFRTQPHFDDERVQWWFGDATKSLLMLPKDYFGSFDMVMVDLSESVMSFSVIKHVDIMEALALLLRPDGIMIKNDLHFRKMSDIFDYTIQLSVTDVPIICEQAFVVGSNSIDFLRPDVNILTKGHAVKMLLLDPVEDVNDSFKLVQKYRKNDARAQGKCVNRVDDSDVKLKRDGLFMVVEAENVQGPVKGDAFENALHAALEKEGLRVVSTVTNESATKGVNVVIVMREGAVVARTWPKEKYCAFDIHLWGRFNTMDSVKNGLAEAVNSPKGSVSSFRIVVGGMRGTDTWKEDKTEIGPKILQYRDCDEHLGRGTIDDGVIAAVVEESLNMIQEKDPIVVVICGNKEDSCRSLDAVKKDKKIGNTIPLCTCPDIENVDFTGDAPTRMFACEMDILKTLRDTVAENKAISAFVVDASAPVSMVRIATSILNNPRHQQKLLLPSIMFIAPMVKRKESWRRSFLDRSRSNLIHSSVFRAEITLRASDDDMEVGILSSGDPYVFTRLVDFANAVANRTGVVTEISDIIGAPPKETDAYKPKLFAANDYDLSPGEAQFSQQKPLGHHIISQLKTGSNTDKKVLETKLIAALELSLTESKFSKPESQVFDELGEGVVAVAVAPEGTAIAVWDGNQRITLNMFTFDSGNADTFMRTFTKEFLSAKVLSRDEQPRGVGRVVNFARDLYTS